jgi:hypothetical protein
MVIVPAVQSGVFPEKLSDIKSGLEHPHLILRRLNAAYFRFLNNQTGYKHGVDIFDRDWDNLIILDACRYDTFAERASLPGEVESVYSQGAATPEFIRANFSERQLHDTVYITSSAWYPSLKEEINSEVHKMYYEGDGRKEDRLQKITKYAKKCSEKYPNKRILVHYMPPHLPYRGPTAEEHLPSPEKQTNYPNLLVEKSGGTVNIPDEIMRQAYRENLDRVLEEVSELLTVFETKTVVTADHGELLGEKMRPIPTTMWGHSTGLYVEDLIEVPWHVYETGKRKKITAEAPNESSEKISDEKLESHLRSLGYKV